MTAIYYIVPVLMLLNYINNLRISIIGLKTENILFGLKDELVQLGLDKKINPNTEWYRYLYDTLDSKMEWIFRVTVWHNVYVKYAP